MDPRKNYYADLELTPTATTNGVQKAYRRLAKRYHPDHAGAQGAERFRAVQEAYQVLSDPGQRRQYDRRIALKRPTVPAPEPLVPSSSSRIRPEPFSASSPNRSPHGRARAATRFRDDEWAWAPLAAETRLFTVPARTWPEDESSFIALALWHFLRE